jgi:hypothetical protein
MTAATLEEEIQRAIPKLLEMARDLTWNSISDNCMFIMTEIKNGENDFYEQRKLNKKMNGKKVPITLAKLMPTLQRLYDVIYDINLHIYKVTKTMTIIDLRYYPKSSLDRDFREKVLHKPPMLHCKIAMPPWLSDKKEKFDINWEHYEGLNKFKLIRLKLKLKFQKLLLCNF